MFTRTSPSNGAASPRVTGFYDNASGSCQYLVVCEETKHAALIDVVQDFDPKSARSSHETAAWILDYLRAEGLTLDWVLDTHPHADHLMASAWLAAETGAPNAIGEKVLQIAELWEGYYNLPGAFDPGADFSRLFTDGDRFRIGNLQAWVMLSPGHTLGSISYVIGDAGFVHDTLMHVDVGTSRADFPGGSSTELWHSLQKILALPDDTRLFIGHDYPPVDGRKDPAWEATVAAHRASNPHIAGQDEASFRMLRDERDATLSLPDRMLHALQVNLRAGRLPPPEADGHSYFKIPANRF